MWTSQISPMCTRFGGISGPLAGSEIEATKLLPLFWVDKFDEYLKIHVF
jgi:hypothetical protein